MRPAPARRPPPPVEPGRVGLTGRAAVLALVVCAVALSLAYPLRAYVAQRSHIQDLRADVAAKQATVSRLRAAQERWDDPAYVKAQAAGRLHYEMPGETMYVVLGPEDGERATARRQRAAAAPARRRRGVTGPPAGGPGSVSAGMVDGRDLRAMHAQLGRPLRGARSVAHRCPCRLPDVVETAPLLPDGTPFPTLFYLTCPRATGAVSTLESAGLMRSMAGRLGDDEDLAASYRHAHEDYLRRRDAVAPVPAIAGVSAGGMPDRVKCLHVLVAHALAAGPGVNPLGDEALAALPAWWAAGPCVPVGPPDQQDGAP